MVFIFTRQIIRRAVIQQLPQGHASPPPAEAPIKISR